MKYTEQRLSDSTAQGQGRRDGQVVGRVLRRRDRPRQRCERGRCYVGPKDAGWPMRSCGNTARKASSWPNFWTNLAPIFLTWRRPRVNEREELALVEQRIDAHVTRVGHRGLPGPETAVLRC